MTVEHFDNALEELLTRRPFQVFTVELNNGRRIEIDHIGAISFRDGRAVCLLPGSITARFDHNSVTRIIETGIESAV